MKKVKERFEDTLIEEFEYSSHTQKNLPVFLAALAAIVTGNTAAYCGSVFFAAVLFGAGAICVVRLIRELHRQDHIEYENYRRLRKAINLIAVENEKLKTKLDLNPDKQYKALTGCGLLDGRLTIFEESAHNGEDELI